MAISFSRPDPSSPAAVAAATFSTARRGFEPTEVRDLLRMVAAELGRLQEREKFLERELRNAQQRPSAVAAALDEDLVTKLLGEEAARILSTAREAATQIKTRAEDGAARLLRESTEEAQRLREEAEVESARKRGDATKDADAELEMARQQGRDMVAEARAYRERVLGELSRRRELARQQIEQLVSGRDRLLQAFDRARLAAVDVMSELTPLGTPTEYVNLATTTGPVPVMVPADKLVVPGAATAAELLAGIDAIELPPLPEAVEAVDAGEAEADTDGPGDAPAAAEPVADRADHPAGDTLAGADDEPNGEADDAAEPNGEADDAAEPDDAAEVDDTVVLLRARVTAGAVPADPSAAEAADDQHAGAVADDRHAGAAVDDRQAGALVEDREPAPVVSLFAGELDVPLGRQHDEAEPHAHRPADDLFARLRASRLTDVAERAAAATQVDDPAPPPTVAPPADPVAAGPSVFHATPEAPAPDTASDDSPFTRRDTELTPVIVTTARKLKRVLADEQNEVLDRLRTAKTAVTLAALLPAAGDHAARYAGAVTGELETAALAGGASVRPSGSAKVVRSAVKRGALQPANDSLTTLLVMPLRERVERVLVAADGDNDEAASLLRGIYREWKTQRIDEHLDDIVRLAYGRGQLAALAPGSKVCWVVDPNGPPCADAEDNSLAGAVTAGEPFPTGHLCAPAHEGCRCLLRPVGD